MTKSEIEQKVAGLSEEEVQQQTQDYKAKLDAENVSYHHNAGLVSLVMKWQEHDAKARGGSQKESRAAKMQRKRKEALRLVRVRITNHNPANKNKQGEIFVVANSLIGEVRSFVPYNCEAAQAYHLPEIILKTLKNRKYRSFQTVTNKTTGHKTVRPIEANEFSFEELEPLTQEQLDKLKRRQAIARGTLPEEEI